MRCNTWTFLHNLNFIVSLKFAPYICVSWKRSPWVGLSGTALAPTSNPDFRSCCASCSSTLKKTCDWWEFAGAINGSWIIPQKMTNKFKVDFLEVFEFVSIYHAFKFYRYLTLTFPHLWTPVSKVVPCLCRMRSFASTVVPSLKTTEIQQQIWQKGQVCELLFT